MFIVKLQHSILQYSNVVFVILKNALNCNFYFCRIILTYDYFLNKTFIFFQERTLPAFHETPYDILQTLCVLKICKFVTHSSKLVEGNNSFDIYLDSSTFISLESASQPYFNHHRRKVYDLLNYFLKVEFEGTYILSNCILSPHYINNLIQKCVFCVGFTLVYTTL